jgi:enolase
MEAIEKSGHKGKIQLGMDVAASEFWVEGEKKYDLDFKTANNDGSKKVDSDGLSGVYKDFVTNYPIVSIEDPFDQDDWDAYAKMTA